MQAKLEWNGRIAFTRIKRNAARGILRAAEFFVEEFKKRVSIPNPFPYLHSSKPGEYPKLRTGAGRAQLRLYPSTVAAVEGTGFLRVYYVGDQHLLTLEQRWDRLGLEIALDDLRPQIAQIIFEESRKG